MSYKSIAPTIALLLLIMVTIGASIIFYMRVDGASTSLTKQEVSNSVKSLLKSEGVEKLPSGGLKIYVRNIGKTTIVIDKVYVYDPTGSKLLFVENCYLKLSPKSLGYVIIPAIKIAQISAKGVRRIRIELSSKIGIPTSYSTVSEIVKIPYKPTLSALRASRSSADPSQNH